MDISEPHGFNDPEEKIELYEILVSRVGSRLLQLIRNSQIRICNLVIVGEIEKGSTHVVALPGSMGNVLQLFNRAPEICVPQGLNDLTVHRSVIFVVFRA